MIEEQNEINGICELKILNGNSILIKSPEFELLNLSRGEDTCLNEATICIGESFNLADADHISETYKLIEIREGSVILEAELTFSGIGIPEEEWTKKKIMSVNPYISAE